jgi:Ser/Thr protein kinase RdoA (MazF antagonist)
MMKLSTLWKIHRLDEADGRNPLADLLLERWEHDQGSARLFRASANSVFVFRRDGARCFLRFADQVERTRESIEAEIGLVEWLSGAGMSVAMPIRSRGDSRVETVTTRWGTFHAVVFLGLDGAHRDIGDLDGAGFRAWGSALGKLHAAMRAYTGPARTLRDTWHDQLASAARQVEGDDPSHRQNPSQAPDSQNRATC